MTKKYEDLSLELDIENEKDYKALMIMLELVFNYAIHSGKDGIDILNLIAKNGYEELMKRYFTSIGKAQSEGIFYDAVENNCIELVKFMLKANFIENPYKYEMPINTAKRLGYSEMLEILEKFNND